MKWQAQEFIYFDYIRLSKMWILRGKGRKIINHCSYSSMNKIKYHQIVVNHDTTYFYDIEKFNIS